MSGCAVQPAHVELFQADLRELRILLFENFAHGVVHGVYCAAPARGRQFLVAKISIETRRFGYASERCGRLKIERIIDLARSTRNGLR
jgi:hypothetical protein